MMTTKNTGAATTITINGTTHAVLNTLRFGPDADIHTYELTGGAYVYAVGSEWKLQERGQFARTVEVGA